MDIVRTAARREPEAAERVRTILSTAGSLSVTAHGAREDVMAGATVEFADPLGLRLPADCRTVAEVAATPGGVPAWVEWTDLAPVPVRDRVRARVRMVARLCAPEAGTAGTVRLRADVRRIALVTCGGGGFPVEPGELASALPDPVAGAEARLLLHLAEDHQEHVEALARLLDARDLLGVTRITPLALDRYGIVLRLEHPRGRRDVRLPFARPLTDPGDLGHHLHALLASRGRRGGRG